MDAMLSDPAFRTYAICVSILAFKMLLSAFYTGSRRQRHQTYINAEDARTFGRQGTTSAEVDSAEVAHALRIQRNDLENIPTFFAVGLVYVLSGASPLGATAYFWTFTVARLVHTVAYMRRIQPLRAICYGVGALCVVGMIVQILLAALRSPTV